MKGCLRSKPVHGLVQFSFFPGRSFVSFFLPRNEKLWTFQRESYFFLAGPWISFEINVASNFPLNWVIVLKRIRWRREGGKGDMRWRRRKKGHQEKGEGNPFPDSICHALQKDYIKAWTLYRTFQGSQASEKWFPYGFFFLRYHAKCAYVTRMVGKNTSKVTNQTFFSSEESEGRNKGRPLPVSISSCPVFNSD